MTAPQQPQMSPDYVQQLRAAGVSEDQIRAMAQAQGATVPGQPQQAQQNAGYTPFQGAQQAVQQGYQSAAQGAAQGYQSATQGAAQGYQSFQQGVQGAAQGASQGFQGAAQGFQNAGAQAAAAAGQFAQGAARKVKGPSVFGAGAMRIGTWMLFVGLGLGVYNIINSRELLAAGAPFLETYFYVEHPIHFIQSWGSVTLVPLGLILTVVGFLSGGRR